MTGWIGALRLMPVMLVVLTAPVMAQTLAVDNGPPVIPGNSDSNAALPQQAIDPSWVPPREVVRMLRSTGYSVLSRPKLRGAIFSVAVVTPRGDDGRLFMDARDGRLLRFVPGYALTSRTEEEVGLAYNPPSPPLAAATLRSQASPHAKSASRAPPATTGVAPSGNPQAAARPSTARSTTAAPSQTQAAARPTEAKPADAKPALVIQPTQDIPPALGLE